MVFYYSQTYLVLVGLTLLTFEWVTTNRFTID